MPKFAKMVIMIFLIVLLSGFIAINLVVPAFLRSQITNRIEAGCETCSFKSENISLRLFPTRLMITQAHFETGSKKNTFVQADVPKLEIYFSMRKLRQNLIKISSISVESPVVLVYEGDQKGKKEAKTDNENEWHIEIDQINLKDAAFSYEREHLGKKGSLHVNGLFAEIGTLGNTNERIHQKTNAHLTATLEDSGAIDLSIQAMIFNELPNLNLDVSLALDHMDLSKTRPFFMNYDGVEIKGVLVHGFAEVGVRGNVGNSKLKANYHDLAIEFHTTFERGGLNAVLSNLFSGVKSKNNQTRSAQTRREIEEPLVGWIFRSMKDSALKVATDQ